MSKMSDLAIDIQFEIERGVLSYSQIAELFDVPLRWVEECADNVVEYDDSMDGDAASALASAGWGTDEDYGYSGEEF